MGGDFYSGREIAGVLGAALLGIVLGVGGYRLGQGLAGGTGGAQMGATTAPAPVNGQTLYANNCAGCHGAQAQGGVGPALKTAAGWTLAQFSPAVLHGQAPGDRALSVVMPHFADTGLDGAPPTDEQLGAIHAYLGTLK